MKKRQIILIHILYWFYIIFQSLFLTLQSNGDQPIFYRDFAYFMLISFVFFYIFYGIVPFLFRQKRKVISILIGVALLALFSFFKEVIFLYSYKLGILQIDMKDKDGKLVEMALDLPSYLYQLRSSVVNGIYAILIYVLIEWIKSLKQKAELITQNQASELALLRSQVSPHFLFNTLNNIDSLIYRDQDKASASVIKLSEIMRYMIYETADEKVLLSKEIEYLESYIALQRLRLKNPDYVIFEVNGNSNGKMIAPMLFVSFVENAFKHGLKQMCSPGIIIILKITENEIIFTSTNYYEENDFMKKDKTSGIGLVNVQRRLGLIYPGKHDLKMIKENGKFNIELKISFS